MPAHPWKKTLGMPAKRIIPCLDVTEGRVVKGVRFKELRDAGDPAELAATYDREGADEIVFLDITASSDARKILLDAVEEDDLVGSQCVVLAIDARKRADSAGWEVFSHGGRRATGRDVVEWAKEGERLGAGEILLTSMDQDGTHAGYDVALLKAITSSVRLPVIASGGAGNVDHMYDALTEGGAEATLAASIFHFGELSIGAVKEQLAAKGLEIRP